VGGRGLEPPTPSLSSYGTHNASETGKGLTPTPSAACTAACTSEPENANAGTLDADQHDQPTGDQDQGEGTDQGGTARGSSAADQGDALTKLAAALLDLTPADRERLAAMLAGHQGGNTAKRIAGRL
jgi:hypothetical protein